jgi:cyclohexadienyl dehydratase
MAGESDRRRRGATRAFARGARGRGALLAALFLPLLLAAIVLAQPRGGKLRVGTSGDYAPFSVATDADGARYEGFDVELARRYARDRGLEIEWVRFRWPTLLRDLEAGRFDVAMSGVTLGPSRSVAGSFSVPVVETGAVVLILDSTRFGTVEALDADSIRIAVNAGGHLEGVARSKFPHATLLAIPDNAGVVKALSDGAVDAAVTDTVEASHWEREVPDVKRYGPFTQDRKAFLVAPGATELAADLDRWLLEREADGSLAALRSEQLGPGPWSRVADPLPALVAAIDERLSLMPWVAVAKRRDGLALVAPAREAAVLEESTSAVLADAKARGVAPPPEALVRAFFEAQMEAARQVQRDVSRDASYSAPESLPDLDASLRPAISRIGARIARLVLALPPGTDRDRIAKALTTGVRTPQVTLASRGAIARSLAALVESRDARAAAPDASAAPASKRAPQ